MSEKQEVILNYIKEHIRENGYPPTVREIANGIGGASSSTVHEHLEHMVAKGVIQRTKLSPRAIKILDPQDSQRL